MLIAFCEGIFNCPTCSQSRFNYNSVIYVACNCNTCAVYPVKYSFNTHINPSIAQYAGISIELISISTFPFGLFFCPTANCDTLDQSIMGLLEVLDLCLIHDCICLWLTCHAHPCTHHFPLSLLQWQLSYNRSSACAPLSGLSAVRIEWKCDKDLYPQSASTSHSPPLSAPISSSLSNSIFNLNADY